MYYTLLAGQSDMGCVNLEIGAPLEELDQHTRPSPSVDVPGENSLDALEGPVSITECSAIDSQCEHEGVCSVGGAWQKVNIAIRRALDDVTLSDLLRTNSPTPQFRFAGLPITVENKIK